jgi:hypothetical protein
MIETDNSAAGVETAALVSDREVIVMSRELNQHSLIAHDLFDRNGTGSDATCVSGLAANEESAEAPQAAPTPPQPVRRANISEELWGDALRRHTEARQSWRSLLDRFVKPHS